MRYHDEEVFGDGHVGLHHPLSHLPNQKQACLICCRDYHGMKIVSIWVVRLYVPDISDLYEAISLMV